MHSILVVAAHPDDEVLGCGGTLAILADAGAEITVAFLADGVSARTGISRAESAELEARRTAGRRACEILGVDQVVFGDFPDNRLDTVPLLELARNVEQLISEVRPDTVFSHHGGDLNIDHRRAHEAVAVACRPQQGHPVKTLLSFEVPSSTEWAVPAVGAPFVPSWHIDISAGLQRKLRALRAYEAEMRPWPHPRSIKGVEHLARWRGASIGAEAAEAFMLVRRLE